MNRREFLFSIAAGLIPKVITVTTPSFLWDMHPSQKAFMEIPSTVPLSLYGVPYHESNAHIGTWLGITRSTETEFQQFRKSLNSLIITTY